MISLTSPVKEAAEVRQFFISTVEVINEISHPAVQLVKNPVFLRLGLADAAIAAVCEKNILVLTADVKLQLALASLGLDALNFNHVRMLGWS